MRVKPERVQNEDRATETVTAVVRALMESEGTWTEALEQIKRVVDDFMLQRNLENIVIDQVRRNPFLWPDSTESAPR